MDCYGVIGHPIKHSVSPAMHNAAFRAMGINAVYASFDVKPEDLKKAIEGAKALGIKGLNVTIPHKEEVLKLVNPDELASKIGAANTLKFDKDISAYNTDAYGALKALESAGVGVSGKTVLIIGAGGAARAIAFALVDRGATVAVTNRTEDRGIKLAQDVRKYGDCIFISTTELEKLKFDILINATPVGMSGYMPGKLPVDGQLIKEGVVVFDTVYNPMETALIKLAKMRGCKVVYGIDMLVYQGVKAFEIWTGLTPPFDVMKRAALNALEDTTR
ncbi:MAG: shikimate dehydrogenase [Archaeoglobus sp.]|nr:MAG: shikimate dehydrogenase [Archaeoglobus sp.]